MKITVIIPNYNKASFIASTLECLLAQSFSDWQAIIVDDASTDDSIAIISPFLEDSRFSLLVNDRNRGGSVSRNRGLEGAKGEFIIFLDSDDLLASSCLLDRLNNFKELPDMDFLVFSMGTFKKNIGDRKKVWMSKSGNNHLINFLEHNLPWSIMQPIWRRGFLMEMGGFDERFPRLQDVELHTRALLKNRVRYRVIEGADVDCFYRVDDARISSGQNTFLFRWYRGIELYLTTVEPLLENNKQRRALRGTYISFLNQLLYQSKVDGIAKDTFDEILHNLKFNCLPVFQLYPLAYKWLDIYCYLYSKGLSKVKGFNRLTKKLFIYVI